MSSTNPRVRKIADRIQVIVAEMLERRIKDPRLGFVTVTDVRVTGDTQQATVFYTVLGEDADLASTGRGAGVGQGRAPLRGRQAARHAARADADLRPDALPENARHLDEVLARARRRWTRRSRRPRGSAYAGEADPYKKPREEPTIRGHGRRATSSRRADLED